MSESPPLRSIGSSNVPMPDQKLTAASIARQITSDITSEPIGKGVAATSATTEEAPSSQVKAPSALQQLREYCKANKSLIFNLEILTAVIGIVIISALVGANVNLDNILPDRLKTSADAFCILSSVVAVGAASWKLIQFAKGAAERARSNQPLLQPADVNAAIAGMQNKWKDLGSQDPQAISKLMIEHLEVMKTLIASK